MNGRSPEVRTSISASEEDQMHSSHTLVSLLDDDKGRRGCLYGEGEFGRTGDEGGTAIRAWMLIYLSGHREGPAADMTDPFCILSPFFRIYPKKFRRVA